MKNDNIFNSSSKKGEDPYFIRKNAQGALPFNQVVRGSNPRTLSTFKGRESLSKVLAFFVDTD